MSSRFTRNLSEVKDVNKLAQHVTTQNDLVQTVEGDVFVVTKNGFQKITGGLDSSDLDNVKTDITNLKSENTKLKNRVTDLETSNTDLISRVEALENPDTTTE